MHTTAKLIKVVILAVVSVAAVMLVIWELSENRTLLPDRAPAEIDQNAELSDTDSSKLEVPPGGGGTSFDYGEDVTVELSSETASLYFKNGGSSLYDASIVLVVQETVILESGLLPPGSVLTSLPLIDGVSLLAGGYDGEIWVQFYDENGDILPLNTCLEGINIEVK